MRAVGRCNMTIEPGRRGEDDAFFEASCKDEDEVEDKPSGPSRAETVVRPQKRATT
jgi:hypothetical protein